MNRRAFVRAVAGGLLAAPLAAEAQQAGKVWQVGIFSHSSTSSEIACLDNRRRGKAICANGVALRQDALDRAVLDAITGVLQPEILTLAVEKALAKLANATSHYESTRAHVDRELHDTQRKLDRLLDALAEGTMPADEIKARLTAEKARKTGLQAELTKLEQIAQAGGLDTASLSLTLWERVRDVTTLLGAHTTQARQMLRKLLSDKIELTPVGAGRKRGYQFRDALTIDRLIGGEALQTSLSMVAPTGFGSQASLSQLPFEGLALSV